MLWDFYLKSHKMSRHPKRTSYSALLVCCRKNVLLCFMHFLSHLMSMSRLIGCTISESLPVEDFLLRSDVFPLSYKDDLKISSPVEYETAYNMKC